MCYMKVLFTVFVYCLSVCFPGGTLIASNRVSGAENLKSTTRIVLKTPAEHAIYFGAFPDFGGPEDQVTQQRLQEFLSLCDRKIAWAYFSQNWFNGITFPAEAVRIISQEHITPFIRLMPRSNEDQFHPEPHFNLTAIINGDFDDDLRNWAGAARDENIPLLIDFAVEMNGNWFPWSGVFTGGGTTTAYGDPTYPDGPEKYRDAYRHIISLFREEGANQITWFFHADIYSNPDEEWNQPKYYYPGDNYIDWIGISLYGPQNPAENYWDTFSEILRERHASIQAISSAKPIALLEFGVTDHHPLGSKPAWLTDAFATIQHNPYLFFNAISYWHENWEEEDNLWATIRIDSSQETLDTFRQLSADSRFLGNTSFFKKDVKERNMTDGTNHETVLFESGFEDGVHLDDPVADPDGVWWQDISGNDNPNYSWPIQLEGYAGQLQLLVDQNKKISDYILNTIEDVQGKNELPTRALHQTIIKKQREDTQVPYIIYTEGTEIANLHLSYSLKYPADLATRLENNGWMVLSEFKTTGDYRLALYVYKDLNGTLYWYMHGDNVVIDGTPYEEFWFRENRIVPVPAGEWFDVDLIWKRSAGNDGKVIWNLNGVPLMEYSGPTMISDPINAIMVFTVYASSPMEQWIDNVRISTY